MPVTSLERPSRVNVPNIMPEYSPYHASVHKRGFDIATAKVVRGLTLIPEYCALLYLKRVLDDGEDYFSQVRDGVEIRKLRTMLNGEETQTVYSRDNPRIPSRGARLIRELRLDEVSQARLVADGAMSMVSYRPISGHYESDFREHLTPKQFELWRWSRGEPVKPGAVSRAQVLTMSQETVDSEFIQQWFEEDVRHAREASFGSDLGTLALATAVLLGHSAVQLGKPLQNMLRREVPQTSLPQNSK